MRIKTIRVNDYDLTYTESGSGLPLVLVHGSLSDYRSWEAQIPCFAQRYRTLAVSLRHAYPEKWDGRAGEASISQHTLDMAAFLERLDLAPVHILGHSRGGTLVLNLACQRPDLIQSLMLADPAPFTRLLGPDAAEMMAKRNRMVDQALALMTAGELDKGLEVFTDGASRPGTWMGLSAVARQIRRDNAWSLKSLAADSATPFEWADAAGLEMPVLLIAGGKSPGIYGSMHDALSSRLKHVETAVIPRASHGMFREEPDQFNRIILDFLCGIGVDGPSPK